MNTGRELLRRAEQAGYSFTVEDEPPTNTAAQACNVGAALRRFARRETVTIDDLGTLADLGFGFVCADCRHTLTIDPHGARLGCSKPSIFDHV